MKVLETRQHATKHSDHVQMGEKNPTNQKTIHNKTSENTKIVTHLAVKKHQKKPPQWDKPKKSLKSS